MYLCDSSNQRAVIDNIFKVQLASIYFDQFALISARFRVLQLSLTFIAISCCGFIYIRYEYKKDIFKI